MFCTSVHTLTLSALNKHPLTRHPTPSHLHICWCIFTCGCGARITATPLVASNSTCCYLPLLNVVSIFSASTSVCKRFFPHLLCSSLFLTVTLAIYSQYFAMISCTVKVNVISMDRRYMHLRLRTFYLLHLLFL